MQHISFMQKLCRGIALVGQLGFSLITPPVVLLWLAHWLQTKYSLGVWVTILALILGLLTSASTALPSMSAARRIAPCPPSPSISDTPSARVASV